MSLSARLDFCAPRAFLERCEFLREFSHSFVIITHNYLITAKLGVGDWDLVSNNHEAILEWDMLT